MFIHPMWDPKIFSVAGFAVHWYGLAYLAGVILVMHIGRRKIKQGDLSITRDSFEQLITNATIGIIVGGRIIYMLCYQTKNFINDPWLAIKIWQGGMSFHGGFLGVLIAVVLFARQHGKFWQISDFICLYAPIGLGLGRLANFVNGELCGKVATAKYWWLIVYPWLGSEPRHPSQLYEMFGEGVVLYLLLYFISKVTNRTGIISACFCMFYGIIRFVLEFYRQPDPQLGYLWHDWLTMGQVLSVIMLLIGTVILFRSYESI